MWEGVLSDGKLVIAKEKVFNSPPLPQILAETYRMAQFTCVDGLRQDWGNES